AIKQLELRLPNGVPIRSLIVVPTVDIPLLVEVVLLKIRQEGHSPRHAAVIIHPRRHQDLISVFKVVHRQPELLQLIATLRSPGRFAGRLHRRQQERHQYSDICDYYQQLDQRKRRPNLFPPTREHKSVSAQRAKKRPLPLSDPAQLILPNPRPKSTYDASVLLQPRYLERSVQFACAGAAPRSARLAPRIGTFCF